ncbi:hypothetical protein [Hyalangium rubrum]|uniref:Lipoprotein n=1 Tax=Hyalangium rubrum TaxID=3103134 RepID=A0ABU5H2V2_9BACT|nr:hypothetical protein [Hyalangium sp. s54d21]MDY7227798.1 hypothetical protein [Hyalangium sp. s54d21]
MTPLRFCLLPVALLGLSGCPSNNSCFIGLPPTVTNQPGLVLVDEPAHLRLPPALQPTCEGELDDGPTRLSVEVSDPNNQPVESQASLGRPATGLASIQFTPLEPGRHHLFVAFEPVGGIHQFEVYAVRNRSTEAPAHTLSKQCNSLERTDRGAWVCDTDIIRDGVVEQRMANSRLLVAGDVVWRVDFAQIQRYVDTGTELRLTASLQHTLGSAEFLLGTANELVLLYFNALQRVTFDGTALVSTGSTSLTPSPGPVTSPGPRGALLRRGDWLGLLTRASTDPTTGVPLNLVCPYQLIAGHFVRNVDPCETFTTTLVGLETGGVWTADPRTFSDTEFTNLRYLEWTETGLVEQAFLPLGSNLALNAPPLSNRLSAVPSLLSRNSAFGTPSLTAVPVYSPERHAIFLEYLGEEFEEPFASPRLIWELNGTGTVLDIRIRPTTP